MAAINDLIGQVEDKVLRERLQQELDRLSKQKKFGLVFEEHIPECTLLYDVPVRKGGLVAVKGGDIRETYTVVAVSNGTAKCFNKDTKETNNYAVDELVSVAQFGEPIYPTLQPIDSVENAPGSKLWHTLIEADNYHALQLLEYLYPGNVDCIYIDPPYNTGARDWKYNNDYVDSSDAYRHSKWLSMIEKRLKIAKNILNPDNSVLIITIDEKEYLHLGCLLEELFPNANMQMVSSVTNSRGVSRGSGLARTDEYIFILQFGNSAVNRLPLSDEWRVNVKSDKRVTHLRWSMLIRSGSHFLRADSKNQFYPIFVNMDGKSIHSVGEPYYGENRNEVVAPDGTVAIWPIRRNGDEGNWQISTDNLKELIKKGYVMLGKFSDIGMPIYYLKKGEIKKVESGTYETTGYRDDGSIISDTEVRALIPGTQWRIASHDASIGGTNLLKSIFGETRFTYPKSLYAEADAIRLFVANKPHALIVDFFAGSGTTLHAVNLLNEEDGGHRRCVMVTNNEVSDGEAKAMAKEGYKPGDDEWEKYGIARYVTWPRTVCSIKGIDVNGNPIEGNYLGSNTQMEDGFAANCEYFKLGFLDKNKVALGKQFKEILPILWMKAGAIGIRPTIDSERLPQMLVLPENEFAVLISDRHFREFEQELDKHPEIKTVFIVTNSEAGYREMISGMSEKDTYQLYRDYLDNFRINCRR